MDSEGQLVLVSWPVAFLGHNHSSVPLPASFDVPSEMTNLLLDTLNIPAYVAAASAFALFLQLVLQSRRAKKPQSSVLVAEDSGLNVQSGDEGVSQETEHSLHTRSRILVARQGGRVVFAFNLSRILSCLALLCASAWSATRTYGSESTGTFWLHVAGCVVYGYTLGLALGSILVTPTVVQHHLALVLFTTWAVYIYRDVWPFATVNLSPADAPEGVLLWTKIAVLTFAAVVVPLLTPRRYVPVDPKNPSTSPHPEQTASLLSLMLMSWLDPTVFEAYRIPHLPIERLPQLADYDRVENLVKATFAELDPFATKKNIHMVWGLMKVFRADFAIMGVTLLFQVIGRFANPICMRNLLLYMETGGEGSTVRPWFWILFLFMGPMISIVFTSLYHFVSTRMLVRLEAILTQLVFDHALRMRTKAAISESNTTETESIGAEDASDDADRNIVGRVNNLITTDLDALAMGREVLQLALQIPFQLALCIWFLYSILGWSAVAGMTVFVVLFPMPGTIASMLHRAQIGQMKSSDARVQSVTETLNVIRMIKLFGWEPRMLQQLKEKRENELMWIRKSRLLRVVNGNLNHLIPLTTMVVTFLAYTIIMKQELTASKVFSSMTVFEMFSTQMHMVFGLVPSIIRAKVSLDRLNDFLRKTELLDKFSEKPNNSELPGAISQSDVIGFRNATFTWENAGLIYIPEEPSRIFTLRIEGELLFKRQRINIIVGPTGSGKTSMLMALLGEMHYVPSTPDGFFSLPRDAGVAYAAQESWVQNETIRDNILFGAPYDQDRYAKVIDSCCLKPDLDLLEAGDLTEVGEKGISLSGGQKARVTLARAIYSAAEILLLDDVLSALDVHTAGWIVEKCFKGDLVRNRTVLLVTHNVTMVSSIAHFVVAVGLDGRTSSHDGLSRAIEDDETLATLVSVGGESTEKAEEPHPHPYEDGTQGKLVVAEEIQEGHLDWPALKIYLSSLGGKHLIPFWLSFVIALATSEFIDTLQIWFIGYWARQYEERPVEDVNAPFYLSMWCLIMASSVVFYSAYSIIFLLGTLRGSRFVHNALISSVLGTTFRWLDKTPTARVIARCTQDMSAIDNEIARHLENLMSLTTSSLMRLTAVVLTSPVFIFPGIAFAGVGGWIGQIYTKAQLSVKREKSNARAPVLGHFSAAFTGLVSIRAYGAEDAFRTTSFSRINNYSRVARIFWNLERWVSIRIEMLGALFTSGLAIYLVYGGKTSASNTGFSLEMAVGFSMMILWWVNEFNETEIASNSLERIQQYLEIEQEPNPTENGIPPAYWPASGALKVENLSASYSPGGPPVLRDISFDVRSGERVGIVGRTGSGKSSLTLSLLRCIFTEGKVYYDGLLTNTINLDALRAHITIVPQTPELIGGTLRQNLDPFEDHTDVVLNDALRSAGLFALQSEMTEGRITLDSQIASGGSNLSVGQKQILALARAIVRQSKLLILDEATSAIDSSTDAIIQSSLKDALSKGITILTVAHRLRTVMDVDRILVLDAGRVVEFGRPTELLKADNGVFRALVDESADRETLYHMATATK